MITIDLKKRLLSVELTDEQIAERLKKAQRPTDHPAEKVLKNYRATVGDPSEGALWLYK